MAMVDRSLWQRIIQQVILEGGHIIRPWFADLQPISLEHGLLEIEVPGGAALSYCRRHAARLFTEAAQAATGRLIGVCFLTAADASAPPDAQADALTAPAPLAEEALIVAPTVQAWAVGGPHQRQADLAAVCVPAEHQVHAVGTGPAHVVRRVRET